MDEILRDNGLVILNLVYNAPTLKQEKHVWTRFPVSYHY